MTQPDAVAEILRSVRADVPSIDGASVPLRLARDATATLPVDGAAVTWMTDTGPGPMLAATDRSAQLLEELQFDLGEGPCIDSSAAHHPILSPDLATRGADRWPGFTAGALGAGIRAVFAFPLQIGRVRVGVLDLYRGTIGPLDGTELVTALSYAGAATSVLLDLQAQRESAAKVIDFDFDPEGRATYSDRAEVHQATGMVAVQAGVDLQTALVLLRASAFASERSLSAVAHDVVTRRVRFP
jgi:hypothetical protein